MRGPPPRWRGRGRRRANRPNPRLRVPRCTRRCTGAKPMRRGEGDTYRSSCRARAAASWTIRNAIRRNVHACSVVAGWTLVLDCAELSGLPSDSGDPRLDVPGDEQAADVEGIAGEDLIARLDQQRDMRVRDVRGARRRLKLPGASGLP